MPPPFPDGINQVILGYLSSKLDTCDISDALVNLKLEQDVKLINDLDQMAGTRGAGVIIGRAFTVQMVNLSDYNADPSNYPQSHKGHHIDLAPPGSFLVLSTPEPEPNALWGGLMSLAANAKDLVGVIVCGGQVRDLAELREVGFPVFARGHTTFGQKSFVRPVAVQVPLILPRSQSLGTTDPNPERYKVQVGPGLKVYPDEVVLADENGILIFPSNWEHWDVMLIEAMKAKEANERVAEDLKKGELVEVAMARWRNK